MSWTSAGKPEKSVKDITPGTVEVEEGFFLCLFLCGDVVRNLGRLRSVAGLLSPERIEDRQGCGEQSALGNRGRLLYRASRIYRVFVILLVVQLENQEGLDRKLPPIHDGTRLVFTSGGLRSAVVA